MYPELFSIFDYSISTFGLMLATAFLVGYWIGGIRMEEEGLDPEHASTILLYCMLGGVFGSKLYFAVDNWAAGAAPFTQLFFARAGITFYGGLMGGAAAGIAGCLIHHIRVVPMLNAAAISLAVGQALGRVGCFLVGDDYGVASDLPWAIAFPLGAPPTHIPVHPTQLYEVAWLLPVAWLLWSRRKRSPFLFGEYLALNGLGRIVIETWRVNRKIVFGITEPQLIGFGLIVVGIGLWLYLRRQSPRAATSH